MDCKLLKLLVSSFCLSCVSISITAQTSQQGFFLDNWLPKSIEILDFDALNQTTLLSTVTVTVDAGTVVSKVSRNIYGHNAAVWGGKLDQSTSMVTNVSNLSPQVIRWPGGNMSNDYFWNASNQASCPNDLPPTFSYNDQLYGANESTSYVMSLNRYYSFLAQTNSTGINCVNYAYARYSTSADPVLTAAKYAADWVRYDNGRTKYWEIGNENYGSWETGYTIDQSLNQDGQPATITGDLYGKHCKVFIEEMRKAAKEVGSDIKIGVVVYNTEGLKFDAVQFWNQGVMSQVGSLADFLIPHYYFANGTETNPTIILNTAAVEVSRVKTMLSQQLNTFAGLGPMPVALTEYNFNTIGLMQQVSYVNGMHGALVLGELIKNQYGQGNRWDFMNGWSNGDNHGLFAAGDPGIAQYTPRAPFFYYYYFQKYFGDKMIASSVTGSTDVVSYASKFSSGQSGIVLVNKGAVAQVVTLKMNNFKTGAKYYYYLLTGGTDNGDFSRKVLVNGLTTTLAGGGPTNYATLKPYGTNVSGDIKLSLPKYATVYVVVENDKTLQTQTIQFNPIPAKTFGDSNFSLSASSTSGLQVQFASSDSNVAKVASNGTIQIVGAGTCDIIAFQDGNSIYNPAVQVVQSLTVTKGSQTIVFPPLQSKIVGDPAFSPGATASSGLACTYTSSNLAVAIIVNNQIEIKGAGTTTITAKQIGNFNYNTATEVNQQLIVGDGLPTFYHKGSGSLSVTTNWGASPDGSGASPASVVEVNTIYVIKNGSATTDTSWTLGSGSKVRVGDAGSSPVTLTVANTFPIIGTIDVAAASSGSNSVVWQNGTTTPSFGTLHPTSEVHFSAGGTYTFTNTPVFGKLFIDVSGVIFANNQIVQTSLTVNSAGVFSLPFNSAQFMVLNNGATATINGTLRGSKLAGFFSYGVTTPGSTFGALQFKDAIGTPGLLTLGESSIIDYSRSSNVVDSSQNISVLPTGVNYANLTLSEANQSFKTTKIITGPITVTGKLTVSQGNAGSVFNTGGFLTLKSTAIKTAVVAPIVGTVTIAGNVTAERYIPAGSRAYRLLSPATTGGTIKANWQEGQADGVNGNIGLGTHITGSGGGANGFDTTTNNASSLFTHTNSGVPAAWTAVANTNVNTLTAGAPYLIYLRGSRQASNISSLTNDATTLRTTGTLRTGSVAVAGLNATADGFSLIGNPYQAQVDMKTVLLASTDLVQGFYYVLNPANGAYSTFDFGLNTSTSGNISKYLQSGQACFVKTKANPAAAPTLSFLETNKSDAATQTAVFRTENAAASLLLLSLYDTAKLDNPVDGLIVAFDGSDTNAVDENDASKLTNFNENMATSNSGKLLSIEKRAIPADTDEIPLNITKYKGKSYFIKAEGSGLTGSIPYLVDTFTNTTTEIPQDGTVDYAYTVDAGNTASIAADRFKIIYSNKSLNTIDNAVSGFALYPNPSKTNSFTVVVPQNMNRVLLTVSNLLGQKLYSQNDLQSGATVKVNINNAKTSGVYLVSLTSGGKTVAEKWIVE